MQIKMPEKYRELSVIDIWLCMRKGLDFESAKTKKLTFDAPEKFMAYLKGLPDKKEKIMYLFFDTETTGLPKSWKAALNDVDNWPRLVQLAWLAYDANGKMMGGATHIVKPIGFEIPAKAVEVHGITTERAMTEGKDLQGVLKELHEQIGACEILVGHNIDFDVKVVGAEFIRYNFPPIVPVRRKICTMMSSVGYCNLPGPRGPKWPKLQELHSKLFGQNFAEAHDAGADIAATARCFFELKRLGIITV